MATLWQKYEINDSVRTKLIRLVEKQEPVFSFAQNRPLASLLTCFGFQAELGGKLDRFSQAMGIDTSQTSFNPWKSEIIEYQKEIGIRLWVNGAEEFRPTEGLVPFFNSLSIDPLGQFSQVIIFPAQIADLLLSQGVELVIVRDWILRSGLVQDRENALDYTKSNVWEIAQNCTLIQAQIMNNSQLAFFGTHDLMDHIMGATGSGLLQSQPLTSRILKCYETLFSSFRPTSNTHLILSYLIGMVLDDLAQPRWYGSKDHSLLANKILDHLNTLTLPVSEIGEVFIPNSFTPILNLLRSEDPNFAFKVDKEISSLLNEIWCTLSTRVTALNQLRTAR